MVDIYSFDKVGILLGYLNTNNLYEWEMFQKLLILGLKKADGFTPSNIDKTVKKKREKLMLEIDIEYCKELSKKHNICQF